MSLFPSLCAHVAIREALAFRHFQTVNRALSIRVFSCVPTVIELGNVERQMLAADGVECPYHNATQKRERGFCVVRRHGNDHRQEFAASRSRECRRWRDAEHR